MDKQFVLLISLLTQYVSKLNLAYMILLLAILLYLLILAAHRLILFLNIFLFPHYEGVSSYMHKDRAVRM